jgi:hypothetical protein
LEDVSREKLPLNGLREKYLKKAKEG